MAGQNEKASANYGYFYTFEGRYYLKNFEYHLAFCLKGGKWEKEDFDFVGPYDLSTMQLGAGWESLEGDQAKKTLGDLLPEPDIFEKTDLENRRRYLLRLEEQAKSTPRRVIGWISDSSLSSVRESKDEDNSHYAAFFRYLKDNGYQFSGEQYQNLDAEPLFDDYTYLSFSRRGFGYLMALVHGGIGRYDYAGYTEFPLGGEAETPHVDAIKGIEVVSEIELDAHENEIYAKDVEPRLEIGESPRLILTRRVDKDLYYWPDGIVYVHGDCYEYQKIARIENEQERNQILEELNEDGDFILLDEVNECTSFPFLLLALCAR